MWEVRPTGFSDDLAMLYGKKKKRHLGFWPEEMDGWELLLTDKRKTVGRASFRAEIDLSVDYTGIIHI